MKTLVFRAFVLTILVVMVLTAVCVIAAPMGLILNLSRYREIHKNYQDLHMQADRTERSTNRIREELEALQTIVECALESQDHIPNHRHYYNGEVVRSEPECKKYCPDARSPDNINYVY